MRWAEDFVGKIVANEHCDHKNFPWFGRTGVAPRRIWEHELA